MSWRFRILPEAKRNISKLDAPIRNRVNQRLMLFVAHFDETVPLPLGGDFKGFFKLRIGDWRIVYEVKGIEQEIIIHAVDKRDKIYKRT